MAKATKVEQSDDGPMRRQHLHVRKFRDGDEPAIVELFNSVYHKYGGFVPRTVQHFNWSLRRRPDVQEEGIFLAFDGERLCGYLVAGSSGNIWELCVADDEREIARILLSEALSYLEKIGVSSVSVNILRHAGVIEELREAGFSEVPALEMFLTTLNPAALVQALVTPQREILKERLQGEISVRLRDVPYGGSKEFSVKINNSGIEVAESPPVKAPVKVELKFKDFLSVLFRGSSMARLFLTGKMKARPFWKLGAVLTLFSTIRLRDPWFFPLSDST